MKICEITIFAGKYIAKLLKLQYILFNQNISTFLDNSQGHFGFLDEITLTLHLHLDLKTDHSMSLHTSLSNKTAHGTADAQPAVQKLCQ